MSTPALRACDLAVLRDAAEDRGGVHAVGGGQGREDGVDLGGELAGRGEHEAERAAGAALAAGELAAEARGHRDREGEGLARAGLAAAEHVAPGEGVGQGVDLDRERVLFAVGREGRDDRRGDAEGDEGGGGRVDRVGDVVREEGFRHSVVPFGHRCRAGPVVPSAAAARCAAEGRERLS